MVCNDYMQSGHEGTHFHMANVIMSAPVKVPVPDVAALEDIPQLFAENVIGLPWPHNARIHRNCKAAAADSASFEARARDSGVVHKVAIASQIRRELL